MNIVDSFLEDTIGRARDECMFSHMLLFSRGIHSIAINGAWGTGKTFFIKHCKMILDSHNSTTHFEKSEEVTKNYERIMGKPVEREIFPPIVTAYYDAWKYDNSDDPIVSLIFSIIKDNSSNQNIGRTRDWLEILSSAIDCIPDMNITNLVKAIRGADLFESLKREDKLREKIYDFLESLLPERGNRLIVFVDELDRCSPLYAIKLLERIKHYFVSDKITFVFSINCFELEKAVKGYYGESFDSCRYLERFFDMKLELPPLNIDKFLNSIYVGYRGTIRDTACSEIIKQMNMGMREASKLVFISRIATGKYTDTSDYRIGIMSRDDGVSNNVILGIVVPIAIGLNIVDFDAYRRFVTGKDSIWLKKIMASKELNGWFSEYLLLKNESYKKCDNKVLVSEDDRIQQLYNFLFVESYKELDDIDHKIGKVTVNRYSKELIQKALSLTSTYRDLGWCTEQEEAMGLDS